MKSTTTYSQTLVEGRTSTQPVADSLRYNATSNVDGTTLAISLASEETCQSSSVPIYHKVKHTKNEIDESGKLEDFRPPYVAIFGATFVGLGVYAYANADSLAAEPAKPGETQGTAGDYRGIGIGVMGFGTVFLAIAAIDALRLRDSDDEVGEVKGDPDVTTESCNEHPIANEQLVLVTDGVDWRASGTSDVRGVVRFALHDLPETAFHDGELHLTIGISEKSVPMTVADEETARLLATLVNDAESRVAIDRAAVKTAIAAKLAQANQALAECQALVDSDDLDEAAKCWRNHAADWTSLGASAGGSTAPASWSTDVPACLADASAKLSAIKTCVAGRERTDDEVIDKATCLADYERMAATCSPLDLRKVLYDPEARLDMVNLRKRIYAKAAPIVARREVAAADKAARIAKAATAEAAAQRVCRGSNVLSILSAVALDADLDPNKMRHCSYAVGPVSVLSTTRDGWMIVSWGGNYTAAIKSRQRHADGAYLRTNATATYLGLGTFDRVDGGSSTIPTFKLSE